MKPTQTNCYECYLDGKREVPATMVTRDDEFLCDGHVRAQGLDTANLIPIEKWRVDHGMTTGNGSENMKERIMKTKGAIGAAKKDAKPEVQRLPCKRPGCAGDYKSTNKYPFCTECLLHGMPYTREGKAILAGADIPAKRMGRPPKERKLVVRVESATVPAPVVAAPARLLRTAAQLREVKEAPAEFVMVQLKVLPEWLDQAWARLDPGQKARALATVLAE